ncbi:LemA protein [Sulfurovum sp. enrichment culture clone C5]|uniref:LemA protein n=1 Tax=Sulfurovum sp. enrichment culture clone C5 TaxID=497650 RepID=A0A0S4XP10_9BACT|nr:LemA protein [Sulfurovum sp. enrichment culture clone C5]
MGYIILGILVLAGIYIAAIYNNLVAKKNQIDNGFAQIEVQLKRRYDLIPNLIEVAKKYMAHEKETLEAVIAARNEASSSLAKMESHLDDSNAVAQFNKAEQGLVGAMGKMNFVMEAYPDLKANENMMQLSEELSTTENRISYARQAYNDFVLSFNTYRQSFPQNLFTNMFGFTSDAKMLEFEDSKAMQAAPKVSF